MKDSPISEEVPPSLWLRIPSHLMRRAWPRRLSLINKMTNNQSSPLFKRLTELPLRLRSIMTTKQRLLIARASFWSRKRSQLTWLLTLTTIRYRNLTPCLRLWVLPALISPIQALQEISNPLRNQQHFWVSIARMGLIWRVALLLTIAASLTTSLKQWVRSLW